MKPLIPVDELKRFIAGLKERNPYPIDLFPEPFEDGGWGGIVKFLSEHGYSSDRIFAKFGRMVWMNCIQDVEEYVNCVEKGGDNG